MTSLPDPLTHRIMAPAVTVRKNPVQVLLIKAILRILRTLTMGAIVVTLPATLQTRVLAVTARVSIAQEAIPIARTLHQHHLVQSLRKISTWCWVFRRRRPQSRSSLLTVNCA